MPLKLMPPQVLHRASFADLRVSTMGDVLRSNCFSRCAPMHTNIGEFVYLAENVFRGLSVRSVLMTDLLYREEPASRPTSLGLVLASNPDTKLKMGCAVLTIVGLPINSPLQRTVNFSPSRETPIPFSFTMTPHSDNRDDTFRVRNFFNKHEYPFVPPVQSVKFRGTDWHDADNQGVSIFAPASEGNLDLTIQSPTNPGDQYGQISGFILHMYSERTGPSIFFAFAVVPYPPTSIPNTAISDMKIATMKQALAGIRSYAESDPGEF